jgi:hypothetical protein
MTDAGRQPPAGDDHDAAIEHAVGGRQGEWRPGDGGRKHADRSGSSRDGPRGHAGQGGGGGLHWFDIRQLLFTFVGPGRVWSVARIDIDDGLRGAQVKSLVRGIESGLKHASDNVYRVDVVAIGGAQAVNT